MPSVCFNSHAPSSGHTLKRLSNYETLLMQCDDYDYLLLNPGFDLMEYFNVRDVLGEKSEPGQSSYVRLGTMPIVQQTE